MPQRCAGLLVHLQQVREEARDTCGLTLSSRDYMSARDVTQKWLTTERALLVTPITSNWARMTRLNYHDKTIYNFWVNGQYLVQFVGEIRVWNYTVAIILSRRAT